MGPSKHLLLLLAVGCSTPHMVVPSDVAQGSEVIEATDRSSFSGALADESFKLGNYAITDVDRDWNSGSTVGVLGFSSEKTSGGFGYKVKDGDTTVQGACVTESGGKSMSLGSGMSVGKSFAKLGCACGGENSPVKVVIAAGTNDSYTGELTTSKGNYKVTAIDEAEGMLSSGEPSGYRVDGDSAIGAVEVLKPGRAFFKKGLEQEEHADLACLYVGLMLYQPPKDE